MSSRPRVKVAVVGSGLAGLTAAYRLCTSRSSKEFEVHLFEKANQLGMDSSSVTLDCGTKRRVDVPMRSFQGGYYPNLIALYKEIGVAFRASDFTYSFSQLRPDRTFSTTLLYNGASGRAGLSMPSALRPHGKTRPGLFGSMDACLLWCLAWGFFVLSTLELLWCQVRLCVLSAPWFRPDALSTLTFEEWASRTTPRGFVSRCIGLDQSWTTFVHDILVPLFSAICTAGSEDVLRHPVPEFLEYVWLTMFTHHYVAELGVRDVVARLARPIRHVHLSTNISSFTRTSDGKVSVSATTLDSSGVETTETYGPFSHIIVATQANQALPILDAYTSSLERDDPQRASIALLRAPLAQFHYVPTIVINHADTSFLPAHASDVRDLNLVYAAPQATCTSLPESDLCVPKSYAMATHVLQTPIAAQRLLQTTNPIIAPRRESVFSVARLQRAVVTPESKVALQSLAALHATPRSWRNLWRSTETWSLGPAQGARSPDAPGIWVCGSYAHGGIPLLEGCVVSARNVVDEIIRIQRTSC
ncbi:FAD/NAD(P)-binding domain-containing protein [Exidia glandulosa HHB12029]|uniref:FAD/NAD(P)-binding domain-containing protein n=1 Tax=Exidia glandulosa HHB12029 TaxID=1314781 RepID=A0A165K042_EXIGL|nr:FAD/NAD(P)-binding domain-containing protein [Exidia glandulosa HHB12029]